jgi:hypothetical protein
MTQCSPGAVRARPSTLVLPSFALELETPLVWCFGFPSPRPSTLDALQRLELEASLVIGTWCLGFSTVAHVGSAMTIV